MTAWIVICIAICLILVGVGIVKEIPGLIGAALLVVIVGALSTPSIAGATRNPHWQTCTVIDKDRGQDNGSYRVYTQQCDTLANQDSKINGKYNSSNLQGKIQVGHTYRFKIVGYRSGFTSHFANILAMEEVPS